MNEQLAARNFEISKPALKDDSDLDPEKLERACRIFAAAGLRVVPVDVIQVRRPVFDAIFHLVRESMNDLVTVDQLQWEQE